MLERKALLIDGGFDDSDWLALTALLRLIEERHQEMQYEVYVVHNTDAKTGEQVLGGFARAMRFGHNVTTIFKRARR